MKKKQFRVQLFGHSVNVADSLILMAARHNSGFAEFKSIKSMQSVGYGLFEQFRQLNDCEAINLEIVGETVLCIDAKINGIWQSVAIIEEVEVFEAVNKYEDEEEEKVNILSGTK